MLFLPVAKVKLSLFIFNGLQTAVRINPLTKAQGETMIRLGLEPRETWITRQQQLAPQLVSQIASELINFDVPRVSAIFAGVDNTGAHIYVAQNADVTCQDGAGFAAIGAGYWHADSQLMFAGHTRANAFPRTLLLIYLAKKHAEVAPGVGTSTDMFMIGPQLGSYIPIGQHVVDTLERIHGTNQRRTQRAGKKSEESIRAYVEELTQAATTKQQRATSSAEVSGGDAPADKKEVGPRAEEGHPEG